MMQFTVVESNSHINPNPTAMVKFIVLKSTNRCGARKAQCNIILAFGKKDMSLMLSLPE